MRAIINSAQMSQGWIISLGNSNEAKWDKQVHAQAVFSHPTKEAKHGGVIWVADDDFSRSPKMLSALKRLHLSSIQQMQTVVSHTACWGAVQRVEPEHS